MARPGTLIGPAEEIVCLCGLGTTFATAAAGFTFAATTYYSGTGTSNFALPVTESPSFDLNTEIDNTRKMTGIRELGQPWDTGEILKLHPTTTLSYQANAYNTVLPLIGLFQAKGYTEGASTPFVKKIGRAHV